jgi:hypothetical protein
VRGEPRNQGAVGRHGDEAAFSFSGSSPATRHP